MYGEKQTHEGGWTEDRINLLKALWSDGKSAGEIRDALGGGVTRSAVIGKVHRLNLEKRAQPKPRAAKPHGNLRQPKVNAIVASVAARARIAPPAFEPEPFDAETDVGIDVTARIGLMDLTHTTCRWPVGRDTGAQQMFCGARKGKDAGPYCHLHTAKAEYRR